MSKDEIMKFDYDKKYSESLIECEDGVDILPSLPEFYECGLGNREHDKLFLLLRIESLKHDVEEEDITKEEREEYKKCIDALIARYDKL